MSNEDHSTLKDVGIGLILGACLAVVFIRTVQLYSKSSADVHAAGWVDTQQNQAYSACKSRELVF
jgi:hypothetical protein